MKSNFQIMGVVKGCHYVLSHEEEFKSKEEAVNTMIGWKNIHNANSERGYSITAMVGRDTIDVIRTSTIDKMYIREIEVR